MRKGSYHISRAENQANQQCHFKSSRWRIAPLYIGTDSKLAEESGGGVPSCVQVQKWPRTQRGACCEEASRTPMPHGAVPPTGFHVATHVIVNSWMIYQF